MLLSLRNILYVLYVIMGFLKEVLLPCARHNVAYFIYDTLAGPMKHHNKKHFTQCNYNIQCLEFFHNQCTLLPMQVLENALILLPCRKGFKLS